MERAWRSTATASRSGQLPWWVWNLFGEQAVFLLRRGGSAGSDALRQTPEPGAGARAADEPAYRSGSCPTRMMAGPGGRTGSKMGRGWATLTPKETWARPATARAFTTASRSAIGPERESSDPQGTAFLRPPGPAAAAEPGALPAPELVCYRLHPSPPPLVPARSARGWMEETPDRFAYRCTPLSIANASGWEISRPARSRRSGTAASARRTFRLRRRRTLRCCRAS